MTVRDVAPNAIRIPISFVRRTTAYAQDTVDAGSGQQKREGADRRREGVGGAEWIQPSRRKVVERDNLIDPSGVRGHQRGVELSPRRVLIARDPHDEKAIALRTRRRRQVHDSSIPLPPAGRDIANDANDLREAVTNGTRALRSLSPWLQSNRAADGVAWKAGMAPKRSAARNPAASIKANTRRSGGIGTRRM